MNKVITRFAPSPTGKAHAGSYRTAMYAWLFARHNNGEFILRIEDTDKERNDKGSEEDILEAMKWLGLNYDHFYRQSEQLVRHQEILKQLIESGQAYISREPSKNDPTVEKDIIRLKNPNEIVVFHDHIRGEISVDTTDLEDFVIARSIDEPLYHLAVVIDDHDEGVTHVIRAEEHIANTPRQILIMKALGWEKPEYAHLPIVLGPDKKKLSKRQGARPVTDYEREGYLPDAVFNGIAMVGWNPAGSETQEIFSREELIKRFDLTKIQKGPAVFNEEKLKWFNHEYLKNLSFEEQVDYIRTWMPKEIKKYSTAGKMENPPSFETFPVSKNMVERMTSTFIERIKVGKEIQEMGERGELDFLIRPEIKLEKLYWKGDDTKKSETKKYVQGVEKTLNSIPDNNWNIMSIKEAVSNYTNEISEKGLALHPYRYALSGADKSPDPFTISYIIGKDETLARLGVALELLST